MAPVIDAQITDQPLKLFKQGKFNTQIPVMIGENANEGSLWAYFLASQLNIKPPFDSFSEDQFIAAIKHFYPQPSIWQQAVQLYDFKLKFKQI